MAEDDNSQEKTEEATPEGSKKPRRMARLPVQKSWLPWLY